MIGENKKWLVTGATGFFGANFTSTTDTLVALTRGNNLPAGYQSQVHGELENEKELRAALQLVKPDYILHAAAMASHEACEANPERAFQINARATQVLAQEAESVGAKFIYISTDAVFDGARGNYCETDPTHPFSIYGESKLKGELAASEATDALMVRTNFFGWSPNNNASILEFFVNNLEQGKRVPGYTDFTVTSLYVRTLAQLIRAIRDQSGVWNIASRDALSKYEFGVEVANTFGLRSDLISSTTSRSQPGASVSRSRDISLDTSKLQEFLATNECGQLQTQAEGIRQALGERGVVL